MAKLYQLPNGDWCDPQTVKSIEALDNADPMIERICKAQIPPRIIVKHSGDRYSIREYATYELACLARDRVAKEVNDACELESEAGK